MDTIDVVLHLSSPGLFRALLRELSDATAPHYAALLLRSTNVHAADPAAAELAADEPVIVVLSVNLGGGICGHVLSYLNLFGAVYVVCFRFKQRVTSDALQLARCVADCGLNTRPEQQHKASAALPDPVLAAQAATSSTVTTATATSNAGSAVTTIAPISTLGELLLQYRAFVSRDASAALATSSPLDVPSLVNSRDHLLSALLSFARSLLNLHSASSDFAQLKTVVQHMASWDSMFTAPALRARCLSVETKEFGVELSQCHKILAEAVASVLYVALGAPDTVRYCRFHILAYTSRDFVLNFV